MIYQPFPFKVCSSCGLLFPQTRFFFYRDKGASDHLQSQCKSCMSAHCRSYIKTHQEHVREWRVAHRIAHSEEIKVYMHSYYLAHREQKLKSFAEYRKSHRHELTIARRKWRKAHLQQARASALKWRNENLEQARDVGRRYRKAHPLKCAAYRQKYRSRKYHAEGTHTHEDILVQLKRQKKRCYYCGEKLDGIYHVDHVIPLSRGGGDGPDNLVIACPHCNDSKGTKLPHEWPKGGRLL